MYSEIFDRTEKTWCLEETTSEAGTNILERVFGEAKQAGMLSQIRVSWSRSANKDKTKLEGIVAIHKHYSNASMVPVRIVYLNQTDSELPNRERYLIKLPQQILVILMSISDVHVVYIMP